MSGIVEWYKDLMYGRNDPRTENWFLISSPGPIITIVVSYIYFSVSAGPRYMRDKKPYTLKKTLIAYNFVQVILSILLVYEGLMSGWYNDYSLTCQPVDYSNNPKALRMARVVYLFFWCKLIELLDTVFFVLRKKQRQISFLHLYHHGMMPICAWIAVRFLPGGHGTLLGVINAVVHIVMYTYYMLSAFGPHMQPYLWWKKYLTIMQIVQFAIIFCHNLQVIFNGCNYPKTISTLLIINAGMFIYMFGSFYVKNYKTSASKRKASTNGTSMDNETSKVMSVGDDGTKKLD